MIAYCYASGHIGLGDEIPDGAIEICRGTARIVEHEIAATSRLSYGRKPLVPGIPEAVDQEAARDALKLYLLWLKQRERPGFRVAIQPSDPFEHDLCGVIVSSITTDDRIRAVPSFDLRACLSALVLPGLQKGVRKVVERRMRQLALEPPV